MIINRICLFPLKKELTTFCEALTRLGLEPKEVSSNMGKTYKWKNTLFTFSGPGYDNYLEKLNLLLSKNTKVESCWCLGTAGSLSAKIKDRDIILAEHSSPRLVSKLKLDNISHLHQGRIITSKVPIKSAKASENLSQEGLVVTMESEAGVKACNDAGIDFVELRVVTDHCNEQTTSDFSNNFVLAMIYLAKVFAKIN